MAPRQRASDLTVCFFVTDLCKRHWMINRVAVSGRTVGIPLRDSDHYSDDQLNDQLWQLEAPCVCVSLFYVNDIGSTGSRGRTRGIPCVYPSP